MLRLSKHARQRQPNACFDHQERLSRACFDRLSMSGF